MIATTEAPAWWGDLFARRQERLRAVILRSLAAADRPMATTMLVSYLHGRYERAETEHALATLAAEGALRCEERTTPHHHGAAVMHRCVYWELVR